jgi:hypothetical protein
MHQGTIATLSAAHIKPASASQRQDKWPAAAENAGNYVGRPAMPVVIVPDPGYTEHLLRHMSRC